MRSKCEGFENPVTLELFGNRKAQLWFFYTEVQLTIYDYSKPFFGVTVYLMPKDVAQLEKCFSKYLRKLKKSRKK